MKNETKKSLLNYSLNITIIILGAFCVYMIFSLVSNSLSGRNKLTKDTKDSVKTITNQPNLSIQLEVQNGTGENRIGAIFRDYLKKKGYDVVELGNYKSNCVDKTLIIDRSGDPKKAQRIADVIGFSGRYISQQINKDMYLDATIIIGRDYNELKPFTEKAK